MAKATINHVAEMAGVSIKTVSRVVNKESNVSEATREKVEAAVAALNYSPSPSARGLASNRSFLIALLYDNPSANYIIHVQKGVLASCRQRGYEVLIHPCDSHSRDLEKSINQLVLHSRVDGVVLTSPLGDMPNIVKLLKKHNLPYAQVSPSDHHVRGAKSYCDDRSAAVEMTEHLIALGHRRIGFIVGHPDHGSSVKRQQGFLAALAKAGVKPLKNLQQQGYYDHESGFSAALKMLRLKQPPTAIFASNDDMAAGVMHAASQLGLKIPDDLSVAGFDDQPVSLQLWPSLTTVRQPVTDMAYSACEQLLNNLGKTGAGIEGVSFNCEVVIRESTSAPAS